MDIANSREVSNYNPDTRRWQQQTWRAGSVSFNDIIVSYAVRYNKTLIDWKFG